MRTDGIRIQVETADGYEVPEGIREALENVAQAIAAEASTGAEVQGYSDLNLSPFSLNPSTGKFGPKGPLQQTCLGGFACSNYKGGSTDCSWLFSD